MSRTCAMVSARPLVVRRARMPGERASMAEAKRCCGLTLQTLAWLMKTVFSITLRQGVIIFSVHQITLTMFVLLILLIAIAHADEMQGLLRNDMEDDLERHSYYYEDHLYGGGIGLHGAGLSVNQKRFKAAIDLAAFTMAVLLSVTFYVATYLLSCVALLQGAVRRRQMYAVAWVAYACCTLVLGVVLSSFNIYEDQIVIHIFGSLRSYQLFAILTFVSFLYGIAVVSAFIVELGRARKFVRVRGERLVLLDHAANASLLSTGQLEKLTKNNSYQFV